MSNRIGRRELIGAAGAAMVAGTAGVNAQAQDAGKAGKVIGIACSPRAGKTTSAAVQICLDGAREQNPALTTELVELGELNIPAQLAAGLPLKEGETDDFPAVAEKLSAPDVVGIIVGSPTYFGTPSALCKAFLDRCVALRKGGFKLADKPAGVVAVGGARNGGQETVIRTIQTALTGQNVVLVTTAKPSVRMGATLWNQNDSVAEDDFGIGTAKDLGKRVAEIAAKMQS